MYIISLFYTPENYGSEAQVTNQSYTSNRSSLPMVMFKKKKKNEQMNEWEDVGILILKIFIGHVWVSVMFYLESK